MYYVNTFTRNELERSNFLVKTSRSAQNVTDQDHIMSDFLWKSLYFLLQIQYTAPAAVTYQAAVAPSAHSAPSAPQIHYSPADTVSSFQFSNPHVSYSNLGLLSQVVGKAASPQVQYSSAPHYVSSGSQQVQYSSPQVQYSHAPQVQYVPQHYSSSPQVQYVQQASHSSPNYIYTSPSKSYNSPIPYSH